MTRANWSGACEWGWVETLGWLGGVVKIVDNGQASSRIYDAAGAVTAVLVTWGR